MRDGNGNGNGRGRRPPQPPARGQARPQAPRPAQRPPGGRLGDPAQVLDTRPDCPAPANAVCGEQIFPPFVRPGPKPEMVALDPSSLTRALLTMPPVTTTQQPYQAPPFRARPLELRFRVVLGGPAGDLAAVAGGVMLATAESLELGALGPPVVVIPSTGAGAALTIGTYDVAPNLNGRLDRLRVTSHSWEALRALRLQIGLSGQSTVDEHDWTPATDDPAGTAIYVELQARQTLVVIGRNLDPHSAILAEVALDGWVWDVIAAADSLEAGLVRDDPSLDSGWEPQGEPDDDQDEGMPYDCGGNP